MTKGTADAGPICGAGAKKCHRAVDKILTKSFLRGGLAALCHWSQPKVVFIMPRAVLYPPSSGHREAEGTARLN